MDNESTARGLANGPSGSLSAGAVLASQPQVSLGADRATLLAYFRNTWSLTETLFSCLLSTEAWYLRPYHQLRHPLIFYYAHPVTFYINKLQVAGLLDGPLNRHFETLFETGVDEMAWDDLHEGETSLWPALEEVVAYRQQVYELVSDLIMQHPRLDGLITMESPGWALVMCFEHERIHLETSSVLIRELPLRYVVQPQGWPPSLRHCHPEAGFTLPLRGRDFPDNPLVRVPAQTVLAGKPQAWPTFGWDNEYGERRCEVEAFSASRSLVSNGEFYDFVRSGAYLEEKYWSRAGWAWRSFRNNRWPVFWVQDGPVGTHRYRLRTLFTVEAMQWDWPVIVNYYEASAYCAWRSAQDQNPVSYRLLREEEHLAMREPEQQRANQCVELSLLTDPQFGAQSAQINHNLQFGSEGPVNAFAANARGFHDVFGNAWQWSEDKFNPLPGFRIHPHYVDFSVPCFDDRHQMLFGGSFISTGDEASLWARFHFRPHFFQHAGFRLVLPQSPGGKYESDNVLDQYLLFHWGSLAAQRDEELQQSCHFPDPASEHGLFPLKVAQLLAQFTGRRQRALDLGCAVGGSSFELARHFAEVVGMDSSSRFIAAARHLQQRGTLSYRRHETGRYFTSMQAEVDPAIARERVHFHVGDACNLGAQADCEPGAFDAVLLSNLLCRLPDPAACLSRFTGPDSLLAPGGVLLIASPNSWMPDYTPREAWLDGSDSTSTLEMLRTLLPGLTLLHVQDLPFLIREHRRKFEYIVSQVTVWKKPD